MNVITETTTNSLDFIIAYYGGHPVFHKNVGDKLEAGQPLTIDSVKLLVSAINKDELDITSLNFKSRIPHNVIRFSTEFREIIFTTPAQVRRLVFADNLPIQTGKYPIPTLVWKVVDTNLTIYAVKENETQVTDDTILYQAPFLNTSDSGNVCMGSAKIKDADSYEDFITQVQYSFFDSIFTHTNTNTLIDGSITELYASQRANNTKTFDNTLLIDTKKTLNDIY